MVSYDFIYLVELIFATIFFGFDEDFYLATPIISF